MKKVKQVDYRERERPRERERERLKERVHLEQGKSKRVCQKVQHPKLFGTEAPVARKLDVSI